jgi:DNA/RNA-binding domain of Phe-tRNA-synthetase-like protein
MIALEIHEAVADLLAGVVSGHGLVVGPSSSALRGAVSETVERVRRDGMSGGEPRRESVRGMLRAGGYKPAGRNKPSQEYLLRTVTESGELPAILNAVDWLNAVSLESGFPISLLAAARLGERAAVRYGRTGERFVFNRSGQELDLAGLICVCAEGDQGSVPLGTPIKDSMAGKITPDDRDVMAVIFAPWSSTSPDELSGWCGKLGSGFTQYCGGGRYDVEIRRSTTRRGGDG